MTTNATNLEAVKERLRKILALARNNTFEGEMSAAIETANKMLAAYHLNESDLEEADNDDDGDSGDESTWTYMQSSANSDGANLTTWEGQLAMFVGRFIGGVQCYRGRCDFRRNDIGAVQFDRKGKALQSTPIHFYGVAEDVVLATELFAELQTTIATAARLKYGGFARGRGRSYADGFVRGLSDRLIETRRAANSAGGALIERANVIVERKSEAAKTWLRESQGVKLGKGKTSHTRHYSDAHAAGRTDGANSSVSANRRGKLGGGSHAGYLA